jgi:hypothetical protein
MAVRANKQTGRHGRCDDKMVIRGDHSFDPYPNFSQPSHSFETIEMMLVRLFWPGMRLSLTSTSPSRRACRSAFFTEQVVEPHAMQVGELFQPRDAPA